MIKLTKKQARHLLKELEELERLRGAEGWIVNEPALSPVYQIISEQLNNHPASYSLGPVEQFKNLFYLANANGEWKKVARLVAKANKFFNRCSFAVDWHQRGMEYVKQACKDTRLSLDTKLEICRIYGIGT